MNLSMTDRLYYHDSFLYTFDAEVREVTDSPRPALILDRTAFYPTSGGQVFDTGWIIPGVDADTKLRVTEVAETEDGKVVHYLEAPPRNLPPGTRVRGLIDHTRRRDHMQQHSGQHVLSAAFVRLFSMPTVSFHMGDDYCSIDLETASLSSDQIEAAERLANEIILENLRRIDDRGNPVEIRIPVVPGVNDARSQIEALAGVTKGLRHLARVTFLPYHRLGEAKYARLGRACRVAGLEPPNEARMAQIASWFHSRGEPAEA